jgi:hypothetical protein
MLHYPLIIFQLTLLRSAELDVELNALKAMVDNVVAFIHQGESSSKAHAPPQMLESLPTRSWETILSNIRQSVSLTLGIPKTLYPRADLDAMGQGFVMTCRDKEALKLVEDSVVMAGQVVDMLGVDMSLG